MIWRDTNVRIVLSAISLAGIGMGINILALGQILFHLTGSPRQFALVLALQAIGALCTLPFSGPLVDALSSRHVHLACSLVRAVLVLAMGLAALTRPPHTVALLGVGAVLLAGCDNIQRSALFKFTAWHIAPAHQARLNGLLNAAVQVGALLGMAVLALFVSFGPPAVGLFVDAAACLLAALLMARARTGRPEVRDRTAGAFRGAGAAVWNDWRLMYRRYRGKPIVLVVLVLCAGDFVFQSGVSTLVVPLVGEHYGGQGTYVSALEAVFAAGMITASFFSRYTLSPRLLPLWAVLQAAAALALAYAPSAPAHFATLFVAGFANLTSITWLLTTVQQQAGYEEKAKMASLRMLTIGAATAGLLPAIGYAAQGSLAAGFLSVTAVMLLFGLVALPVAVRYRPRPAEPKPVGALT
ncbi:MFS transporter [Streptomyces sp. NBC_01298]|uniref:MFS transporter n=1 Tax=Streptomyces sp. NBC_01298 TaxID=2903817 RepID=UPI002E15023F|nr:MFS transporter [Streptomyces sp. NBC_01298]